MNEKKKYNQILDKKEMSKEEAEKIIDEMYHDKIKVYGEGNVVHVDLIGTVKYTNLEFASIRLLREVVCLENEIRDLYKMMSAKDERIDNLMEMINRYNDMQYIRKIEELYISKDKIKELREIDNIDLIQFKLKELLGE